MTMNLPTIVVQWIEKNLALLRRRCCVKFLVVYKITASAIFHEFENNNASMLARKIQAYDLIGLQ